MSSTVVVIDHTTPISRQGQVRKEMVQKVVTLLEGLNSGTLRGKEVDIFPDGAVPKPAVAHVDLVSMAARTVLEVNGAPFTAIAGTVVAANDEVDIDGTDAADAADLARAINASTHANISNLVKAVNPLKDKLTAATAVAGDTFKVTLADDSVHTFNGKAGASTVGSLHFSVDTSNNAVATDIAAQVNGYSPFTDKIAAIASSAVVQFRSLDGNLFTLVGTATTLAESGGAAVTVSAIQKGGLGNALTVKTLGIVANGTFTLASVANNDTLTINGQTFTAKTTGATGDEWTRGGTDTADATSLAAAINASATALVNRHVRATSDAAVVTVMSKVGGKIGNAITIAAGQGTIVASGARLTGGTVASHEGVAASGTVTISTGSGSITATINGVAIAVTWATSDNNTATLLANAINESENALVQGIVDATVATNVVTITAQRGGFSGNTITLAASGTGATASVARLASGALPTTVVPSNVTTLSRTNGTDRASNGTGGAVTKVNAVF